MKNVFDREFDYLFVHEHNIYPGIDKTIKVKKGELFEIQYHDPHVDNQKRKRRDWESIIRTECYKATENLEIKISKRILSFDKQLAFEKKEFPDSKHYTPMEIETIISKTKCTKDEAVKAMDETDGDVAASIIYIIQKREKKD